MALPTKSSSVVTAVTDASAKRKRDVVDLTEDEDVAAVTLPTMPTTRPISPTLPTEENNDDDEDQESMIEDYADYFEMAPYQNSMRPKFDILSNVRQADM